MGKNEKSAKYSCSRCGLYKDVKTYKMQPYGGNKQKIMNIGEAPGSQEDEAGHPWAGRVGQYLQKTYKRFGIDIFDDCVNVNSVNCRPKNNKTPTDIQIACCREVMVEDMIKEYNPDLIMLFGTSAVKSFMKHRWRKNLQGINRWRGWTIPDQDYRAWVCPVFHPSFVVRSEEHVAKLWNKDIRRGLEMLDKRFPVFKKPNIEVITDLSRLQEINSDITAFDYETTGKKPQADGHRIVTVGIADTPDHAFVFAMPESEEERKPFLDYLTNPAIGKVAQNMTFEQNWSKEILGVDVKGWLFDTMLAAHILDNRTHATGLKFQVYVNFGIIDYASEVDDYIYTGDHGNDFNRIDELIAMEGGMEKLLTFVGWDANLELRTALDQMQQLNYDYLPNV
jgi:DNA polymerase